MDAMVLDFSILLEVWNHYVPLPKCNKHKDRFLILLKNVSHPWQSSNRIKYRKYHAYWYRPQVCGHRNYVSAILVFYKQNKFHVHVPIKDSVSFVYDLESVC